MDKAKYTKQANTIARVLGMLFTAVVLYRAGGEFYAIAWGTGTWWGEFSRTWALLHYSFVAFCVLLFVIVGLFIWNSKVLIPAMNQALVFRERLGIFRWLLIFLVLVIPPWFFQYTTWGFVFQEFYIRVLVWAVTICLLTFVCSRKNQLAGWNEFLASLVLTASSFSIAFSLQDVVDYPFSLGWSEGNRLWDYSIMFGRELYIYPADKGIPVLLDFGRRLVGGLPFIIPGINITVVRLWVGLTSIVPYFILGLALFRRSAKNRISWLLLVLWTFLFLKQGPIHPPLVLSAAMVALAWNAPLRYAIPLVMGAGYFAEASRFTWLFAPGIWIFMLEFSSKFLTLPADRKSVPPAWKRALILGALGIFGGFVLPNLLDSARALMASSPASTAATPVATVIAESPVTVTPSPAPAAEGTSPNFFDRVVNVITIQPLLWYRLLPNSTYDKGILLSLLLAIAPLVIILTYLSVTKLWTLGRLQKLVLVLPLLAFLAVGLVASTKIGGGGDLHNMDMFLIGLLFMGVLAWYNGGSEWFQDVAGIHPVMRIVVVALLVSSSTTALFELGSRQFGEDASWLKTLSDSPSESALDMLPTRAEVVSSVEIIQSEVDKARLQGDVLFIDQRQLLTFGAITDVALVPEYEKKMLMNQALSEDADYFYKFYADLTARRFSLIISEPLRTTVQDGTDEFAEENNAWVKWVSAPVLCYYTPLKTIQAVNVQLLVPAEGVEDCSAILP
ncbi:MAG: hypothetical protein HY865_02740 [Chloroflexi bacterium]|nr:hypothetical protein [Chloroflexota bacterium]